MAWREYHDLSKHRTESLRRTRRGLHWANMPNPFRHYEGVPVLDLPADPPAPPAPQTPAIEILRGGVSKTQAGDGAAFLSQLMFYSTSITASKRVPSTGFALGVFPQLAPALGSLRFHCLRNTRSSRLPRCKAILVCEAPKPMQRLVSLTRLWEATRLKVSQELPSLFQIF